MPGEDGLMQPWQDEMRAFLGDRVLLNAPTAGYASLRVGGEARAIAFPRDGEELRGIVRFLSKRHIPFAPVGNWTNLFVTDGGYPGVLISLAAFGELAAAGDPPDARLLAGAGVSLAEIVRHCIENGRGGLEFYAGIPGTVGGAVRMNAGAFGRETKDVLIEATLMDSRGDIRTVPASSLPFAYRRLSLPADTTVLGAQFRLEAAERTAVSRRVQDILEIRRARHPLEYPNAGSIFRNPPGQAAGAIIDALGLRGKRWGGAQISEKHGNFIVNLQEATAGDVLRLIDTVRETVRERTGIDLEEEVRIVGERHALRP